MRHQRLAWVYLFYCTIMVPRPAVSASALPQNLLEKVLTPPSTSDLESLGVESITCVLGAPGLFLFAQI
jgi:hypothetical protein